LLSFARQPHAIDTRLYNDIFCFLTSSVQPACYLPVAHPPCDDVTWRDLCLPILMISFPPSPGTAKHFISRSAWIPSRPFPSASFLDCVVHRSKFSSGIPPVVLSRNFLKFGVEYLSHPTRRSDGPCRAGIRYLSIYMLIWFTARQ
jgi:hypothetical protein